MSSIIFNAISGSPINNGSSISVSWGISRPHYVNNFNNTLVNFDSVNNKYQNKFLKNDIEYALWPPSGNYDIAPSPTSITVTPSTTQTRTPTATQTPTPSITVSITSTVTPSVSSTSTPTITPTVTPTTSLDNTPNPSPSTTQTQTPTQTTTPTQTPSISATTTPSPTNTVTPSVTSTTSVTPTPTITPSTSPIILITSNTANFNNCGGNVSNVGTNGISSYYGAYDMAGNVWEWTETLVDTSSRVFRGGNFDYTVDYLSSPYRNYTAATARTGYLGFRIAATQLSNTYTSLVYVGDINNTSDSNGFGNVNYGYYIGINEITNQEYVDFLNAVAQTDTYALYISNMTLSTYGGIQRSGAVGSYTYTTKNNMANRPVNFVNWSCCARYCNWLHNGKPNGSQVAGITEDGAYDMSISSPTRDINAMYFLTLENEWYKAAFYKGNGLNSGYWLYPTQSDTAPTCVTIDSSGNAILT